MSQNEEFESTIETLTPQQRNRAQLLHGRVRRRTRARRGLAVLLMLLGGVLLWWAFLPDLWW